MAVAISNTAKLNGADAVGGNVTYATTSIGTADENRIVVVGATCEDAQDIPTTATINYGAGAVTMLATANAQQGAVSSRIFYAWAPTGTTADIVIGFAGGTVAAQQSAIVVYKVTGARIHILGAGMASTDMDSNTPLTTSAITTLANGGLILSAGGASTATTFTWSANVTESATEVATTGYTYGAAHTTTAISGAAVTCTGNVNGQDGALAWIAFGPGANTNAAYAGAGALNNTGPVIRCQCSATFSAIAGSLFADGSIQAGAAGTPWAGEGAFIGAGQLASSLIQFTAGKYDETGEVASLAISADAFTELEFGLALDYNSVNTGDTLAFRVYVNGAPLDIYSVTPTSTIVAHAIPATALLAGAGNFSARVTSQRMAAQIAYAGAGLFSAGLPKAGVAAPQLVQGNSHQNGGSSSTTCAVTLGTTVGNGNMLIVSIGAATANDFITSTVTDDKSNIYTQINDVFDSGHSYSWATYYCLNITNAPQIITATFKVASTPTLEAFGSIVVDEFSGVTTSLALDGHTMQLQTGIAAGTGVTSGNCTTTIDGDLVYSSTVNVTGAGTMTKGASFTQGSTNNNQAGVFNTEFLVQGSASSSTAGTYTHSATDTFITSVAGFKAVGSGDQATEWMILRPTAAFAGVGTVLGLPVLRMRAFTTFAGIGNLSANITLATVLLQGTATFAGVGTQSATMRLFMASTAAFAGTGTLADVTAKLILRPTAAFVGASALLADASISVAALTGSAAFIGTGSLVPSTTHFSAGKYDESGEVTSQIAADAYSELEFGLKVDLDVTAQTGDVLTFRVYVNGSPLDVYSTTPSITVAAHAITSTAAFIGAGNLAADASIVGGAVTAWQGSAAFIGVGTLVSTATMLLRPIATFAGVGTFSASNPTLVLRDTATYQGAGTVVATPRLFMAAQSSLTGVGTLLATTSPMRMPTSVAFSGVGTLLSSAVMILRPIATFVGAGTLTVDAIIAGVQQITAIFAGIGNLSTTATLRMVAATTTFQGVGILSATPQERMAVQMTLIGFGSFSANVTRRINLTAEAFAGVGTIIATAKLTLPTNAAYQGAGNLAASAVEILRPTAAFSGVGTLIADLVKFGVQDLSAAFSGVGTLTIAPQLRMVASATFFAGDGALSVTPALRMQTSEAMAAAGTLVASAPVMSAPMSATFAGAGSLAANRPIFTMVSNELLAGVGTLLADLTLAGAANAWQGSALFAGVGTLTALNLKQWMAANVAYVGSGTFSATPRLRMRVTEAMTGSGTLDASAAFMLLRPRVTFAGAGALVSSAGIFRPMRATYAGAGNFVSTAKMLWGPIATYAGTSNFAITPRLRMVVASTTYTGDSTLSITSTLRMRAATTAFTGAGLMSVNMLQFGKGILIEALLAGTSTLTAIANMQIVSAAQFAAEGTMTADIIKFVGLELFASGTGSLIVDMQLAMAAQQMYSGAGYLNVRFSQISLHGAAADRVVLSDTELRAATADPELHEIMTDDDLRGVIADIETRTTEATQ